MKFRYIEAWSVDVEISDAKLKNYGLDPDELDQHDIAAILGEDIEMCPSMFEIIGGQVIVPANGVEIYSTKWQVLSDDSERSGRA
ncbi:MAG: hypothetical protein WC314_20800 [Vulcanimicrobiota bacterium]